MTKVLITGGRGFLGQNLAAHLTERLDCETRIVDVDDSAEELRAWLLEADIVFHLAGVNRPKDTSEFGTGNAGLTEQICQVLKSGARQPKIVFSSSVQAALDNPYGISKRKAEDLLRQFGASSGVSVRIYRLKNLFGKWSRPNYNSVVATFCHNIAADLPISVSDPAHVLEFSYVDDVVAAFLSEIEGPSDGEPGAAIPAYQISLGELAGRIQAFHDMRSTLMIPDFEDWFNRALYATYLSHLAPGNHEHALDIKSDARGSLAEFLKSKNVGQIFVSRTRPGVTRGNHYHHTKAEKFMVLHGSGLIRMRPIQGGPVEEYAVNGSAYQVIDIPPGFTHSITNVGSDEMVTLFWADEIFNPNRPDTYYRPVDFEQPKPVACRERP